MRKPFYYKSMALFSITTLVVVAAYVAYSLKNKPSEILEASFPIPQYPIEKHLRYSFTLSNTSQQFIASSEFWAYAPMALTATQKTQKITSSYPHQMIKDKYHNQILHFTIKNMAPYAKKNITVDAQLNLAQQPNPQPPEFLPLWLEIRTELASTDKQLSRLAQQLKQQTPHQSAKSVYQWVANTIQYSGYNPRERSLGAILADKQGDCSEYMRLFTALARKNHIPTREVAGYISQQNQILHSEDMHNWAEYYHDKRWHLVDAQNKNYRDKYQNYIAFRHYGDDPDNPLNKIHRYKISDKRIKVIMN